MQGRRVVSGPVAGCVQASLRHHTDDVGKCDSRYALSERVDICICTFRRSDLYKTLESICHQIDTDNLQLKVIIIDNDDVESARPVVDRAIARLKIDCLYLHAPARNISLARNAAFAATSAPYVLCIDDDEVAAPRWVRHMVDALRQSAAGVVIGPVHAVYSPHHPRWMREMEPHSAIPRGNYRAARLTHIGNAGFRGAVIRGRRFDLLLGRSGGEDTEFFSRLRREAVPITYCDEAKVFEPVSEERASMKWLVERHFRIGQTYARSERPAGGGRLPLAARAAAKALACLGLAAANLGHEGRAKCHFLRFVMHAGVLMNALGLPPIELY
ncbi:MAG TPA: glycosyltransferase family 2 protein [Novosphingobium sp.]|nr:glycosyltransferase family 2 protein [Novosphingobium sp.]HZV09639.1 glycosyltransferase family 2 protein [Novosphingobium sp.]